MPFIGNSPYQVAFLTDTFSGNGSTTAFTMSVAPANTTSVLVVVSGVLQDPSTYSVSGTTLTFTGAPPTGTGNISARYLGIPASGVTTTAYRTVTEFTATANQKTFTPPSYTVGFINVYRNGVLLGSADYTATNGTTVVLTTGATSGDLVTVESFLVSSVLNAIPATAGSILLSGSYVTGVLPKASMPTGSVLQVIQGVKTDTFVTSATVTDTAVTGLTVAITPLFSTSKILVICNLSMTAENAQGGAPKLTRTIGASTTQLSLADAASSRSRGSFAGGGFRGSGGGYTSMNWNQNLNFLDSPATTSATTYGVQVSSLSTGTYVNRSGADTDSADQLRSVSYITVMEIAA